ncbi:hypothetical protein [Amycolatopsis sp. Hca4]|uniref:hypothetical protein n=1 Tax=Amycolatopsis sp. Hca4 TaxID=2742131 RepID=UPI0015903229|nr:hypothetical protein [Amycolatopsis sp. Hca4]QKV75289.1 hypothetical protein HUT10_17065 [Amycolatopsis sp. Hca4]
MAIPLPAEVADELRRLKRGRGLQTPRLSTEVGPALRSLCGISESDTQAAIREKVRGTLGRGIRALPPDLREVIVTAMALDADMAGKFLGDRVRLLSARLHRDVRTIRRRVDEAIDMLAEEATGAATGDPGTAQDWHVERLEALLKLDGPNHEFIERRRIVAERDLGDRLQVFVTLPVGDTDNTVSVLDAHPVYGAEVLDCVPLSSDRAVCHLRLPAPLAAGQRHEYSLSIRAAYPAPGHQYVFFPERPCSEFDLRVRFAAELAPASVNVIRGAFHRAADDPYLPDETIAVDALREVHTTFDGLAPGYAYGIRWKNRKSA